jgi:hypothetical protein
VPSALAIVLSMEAKNPAGKTIVFDPENHSYKVKETNQILTGVTTFIGDFFPKFDADKWAPRTAKKRGTTTESILEEWAEKAKRGRDEGHNVHEYAEASITNQFFSGPTMSIPEPLSNRCSELFVAVDRAIAWLKTYYDFVATELIVFSPRLKLAGTIDLVMINENGLCLFDWKQNRVIKTHNPYQRALGPLKHLEDHDFNKYSLQLNVYRRIIEEENYYPSVDDIDMNLIHITPEGYFPMRVKPMNDEVTGMLKNAESLFPGFMD